MRTTEPAVRPATAMVNIGLGAALALGITATAYLLIDSWGGVSWVFGSVVSVVVGVLALLRERQPLLTAVGGLVVTAVAGAVALAAGDDLPQEPAPSTALALSVLLCSAVRTLPPRTAAGVSIGGIVVAAAIWVDGPTPVTVLATLAVIAALLLGQVLRGFDSRARTTGPLA